jgi:hypothetical protein
MKFIFVSNLKPLLMLGPTHQNLGASLFVQPSEPLGHSILHDVIILIPGPMTYHTYKNTYYIHTHTYAYAFICTHAIHIHIITYIHIQTHITPSNHSWERFRGVLQLKKPGPLSPRIAQISLGSWPDHSMASWHARPIIGTKDAL